MASFDTVAYRISTLQQFRKELEKLKKEEMKKYGCYQYLENNQDWKEMLKRIKGATTIHNKENSLNNAGSTKDNAEAICKSISDVENFKKSFCGLHHMYYKSKNWLFYCLCIGRLAPD